MLRVLAGGALSAWRCRGLGFILLGLFFLPCCSSACRSRSASASSGFAVIALEHLGVMALPTNVWTGIAKYPLLALPMFVLAGHGVRARRRRRSGWSPSPPPSSGRGVGALGHRRRAGLPGAGRHQRVGGGGFRGGGGGDAAGDDPKQGYPRAFSASLIAAAGSTAVLIPPSIPFIVYAVLVPGVSVPALFLGGVIPGLLAGIWRCWCRPSLLARRAWNFGLPDLDGTCGRRFVVSPSAMRSGGCWRRSSSSAGCAPVPSRRPRRPSSRCSTVWSSACSSTGC